MAFSMRVPTDREFQRPQSTRTGEPSEGKRSQKIRHFARPARIGRSDLLSRAPELAPLPNKKVVIVGLGCLGSTTAMSLARAGVGELHLVDHDFVDPATTGRW